MDSIEFSHRKISRMIWSLDPFEPELKPDARTLHDINKWAQARDIVIEPVYIFTPVTGIEMLAVEKIEERMIQIGSELGLNLSRPRVLTNPSFSVAGAVDC